MVNRFYKWQINVAVLIFLLLCNTGKLNAKEPCNIFDKQNSAFNCKTLNHPFYVSVTEINQNTKEKMLEISCKMFLDDFEKTLVDVYKTSVDLSVVKDKAKTDKLVSDYLNKHLQLKVNGKPVTIQYIGFEKENEAAWCYLQVSNVQAVKHLEVKNTLLFEKFDSQISIMHVT